MDSAIDYKMKQKNKAYYNYLSNKDQIISKSVNTKDKSFGSQKIDFSNSILVPSEYEGIAYSLYFLLIPYIAGNIFLFLIISNGSFASYKLLDTSSFFIIWIIGYEIVATIMLSWIAVLFFKYDEDK